MAEDRKYYFIGDKQPWRRTSAVNPCCRTLQQRSRGPQRHVRFRKKYQRKFLRLQALHTEARIRMALHFEDHNCTRFVCKCGEDSDTLPRCRTCGRELQCFRTVCAPAQWWVCPKGHAQADDPRLSIVLEIGRVVAWKVKWDPPKPKTVKGHRHKFVNNGGCAEAHELRRVEEEAQANLQAFWEKLNRVPVGWLVNWWRVMKGLDKNFLPSCN